MLNFLIYEVNFAGLLNETLLKTKDLFVFGCTDGLRRYSIHSHLTAPGENGGLSPANEPSTEKDGPETDLESFKNFKMNSIVGNNGQR